MTHKRTPISTKRRTPFFSPGPRIEPEEVTPSRIFPERISAFRPESEEFNVGFFERSRRIRQQKESRFFADTEIKAPSDNTGFKLSQILRLESFKRPGIFKNLLRSERQRITNEIDIAADFNKRFSQTPEFKDPIKRERGRKEIDIFARRRSIAIQPTRGEVAGRTTADFLRETVTGATKFLLKAATAPIKEKITKAKVLDNRFLSGRHKELLDKIGRIVLIPEKGIEEFEERRNQKFDEFVENLSPSDKKIAFFTRMGLEVAEFATLFGIARTSRITKLERTISEARIVKDFDKAKKIAVELKGLKKGELIREIKPSAIASLEQATLQTAREDGDFSDFMKNAAINIGTDFGMLGLFRGVQKYSPEVKVLVKEFGNDVFALGKDAVNLASDTLKAIDFSKIRESEIIKVLRDTKIKNPGFQRFPFPERPPKVKAEIPKEVKEELLREQKRLGKELEREISPEFFEAAESLSGFFRTNELGLRRIFGLPKKGRNVLTDFLEGSDLPSIVKRLEKAKPSKTKNDLLREIGFLKATTDVRADEAFGEAVGLIREARIKPKIVPPEVLLPKKVVPEIIEVPKMIDGKLKEALKQLGKVEAPGISLKKIPKIKTVKRTIETETGIIKKTQFIVTPDGVTEFDIKDLNKLFKEAQKQGKEENRAKLKVLLESARDEGLFTRFRTIKKEVIGGKTLESISEKEITQISKKLKESIGEKQIKIEIMIRNNAKEPTFKEQRSTILFNNFRSIRANLRRLGEPGKKISKTIDDMETDYLSGATQDSHFIFDELEILTKQERKTFIDVVEKGTKPISENQANAIKKWEILREAKRKEGISAGMDIGFIENYYPHTLKKEFADAARSKKRTKEIITKLVNSGISKSDANKFWGKIQKSFIGRKFGSFEQQRLFDDLPKAFLDTDPVEVINKYIVGSNRRINEVRHFGFNGEKINNLIADLAIEGGDARLAKRIVDDLFNPRASSEVISALTDTQVVLKMGLSAITNLGEITLTSVRSQNAFTVFKASIRALSKAGKREARELGNVSSILEEAVRSQVGGSRKISKAFLEKVGFTSTQDWANRTKILATVDYAKNLAKQIKKNPNNALARRMFTKLGGDVAELADNGFKMTDSMRRKVGITNLQELLPIRKQDLPLTWHTGLGRVVTQFKSFAFQWGKVLYEDVAGEAIKGNLRPLMNLLLVGTISGEVVIDIKDVINSVLKGEDQIRPMPKSFPQLLGRIGENLLAVGGIGLLTDFLGSLKFAQFSSAGSLSVIAGPTGSDLAELLDLGVLAKTELEKTGDILRTLEKVGKKAAKETLRRLTPIGRGLEFRLRSEEAKARFRSSKKKREIRDIFDDDLGRAIEEEQKAKAEGILSETSRTIQTLFFNRKDIPGGLASKTDREISEDERERVVDFYDEASNEEIAAFLATFKKPGAYERILRKSQSSEKRLSIKKLLRENRRALKKGSVARKKAQRKKEKVEKAGEEGDRLAKFRRLKKFRELKSKRATT